MTIMHRNDSIIAILAIALSGFLSLAFPASAEASGNYYPPPPITEQPQNGYGSSLPTHSGNHNQYRDNSYYQRQPSENYLPPKPHNSDEILKKLLSKEDYERRQRLQSIYEGMTPEQQAEYMVDQRRKKLKQLEFNKRTIQKTSKRLEKRRKKAEKLRRKRQAQQEEEKEEEQEYPYQEEWDSYQQDQDDYADDSYVPDEDYQDEAFEEDYESDPTSAPSEQIFWDIEQMQR